MISERERIGHRGQRGHYKSVGFLIFLLTLISVEAGHLSLLENIDLLILLILYFLQFSGGVVIGGGAFIKGGRNHG
jgi:hypothetical protein